VNIPARRLKLTLACNEIDRRLQRDPVGQGVALSEGTYALEVDPLRVIYTISEADRIVEISLLRMKL
jgi:hypothetical protein